MEAAFFDEVAADKEVIKSLRNEIERLQGLIMRTIVKTTDGKFYDVSDLQELSLDEVTQIANAVSQEASVLSALVAVQDQPAPADPTPPVDPTPPAEQPLPAPVADPTPAPDQPVADQQVDPAQNPPVTLT